MTIAISAALVMVWAAQVAVVIWAAGRTDRPCGK